MFAAQVSGYLDESRRVISTESTTTAIECYGQRDFIIHTYRLALLDVTLQLRLGCPETRIATVLALGLSNSFHIRLFLVLNLDIFVDALLDSITAGLFYWKS